jgi:hypothetical protein
LVNRRAYVEHLQRWRRVTTLTWWRRFRVRRALARRYRDRGLPPPAHAFVDSAFAAAIATGIATGVRWLQRHPETHGVLFGRALDPAALRDLVRAAVAEIVARFEFRPDPRRIEAAIEHVTAAPPRVLPASVRAPAREVESLSRAHELAASDGATDQRLFFEPLEAACARIYHHLPAADRFPFPEVNDPIVHAVDENFERQEPTSPLFLVRVFDAWYAAQPLLATRVETLAFASFFGRRYGLDYRAVRDIALAHHAHALYSHADFWIAADGPKVHFDTTPHIHRVDGPAIDWRDGAGIAYLHGVCVPRAVCEGRFSITDIFGARNAEIRRTMIDLYERGDRGRFLRNANPDVLQFDYDRLGHQRRLLRFLLPDDEPYVGVEVTNSTPEPDGTYKRYILRVPPSTTSCRAGIAWTFGLTEHEYDPEAET